MSSSLITLVLAVLTVIGFFYTTADRIRARRNRAEEKEASEIKKAVDAAVSEQRDIDEVRLLAAKGSSDALVGQLVERTEALRRAEADRDFYRAQLFDRFGDNEAPPRPPENP